MAKGDLMFDAIVVGGSYSGAAAALQLARARRKVLVIDAGKRRNRFASSSHGFLSRDGHRPEDIAGDARLQLMKYPTVTWVEGKAEAASGTLDNFTVSAGDAGDFQTRRLVLAGGIVDELPQVPGLAELWGKRVFHCPYCHGYELNQGQLGVLATGPLSLHQGLMIPEWGPTTLFTNGRFDPSEAELAQLSRRGVELERTLVTSMQEAGDKVALALEDGREAMLDGLFTAPQFHLASPLAGQLGCEMEAGPMGAFVKTDMFKETTVPGVYAAGDMARAAGSVTFAVYDGAQAGFGTHRSLMMAGLH
jgi:thioredoxin reductase